MNLRKARLTYVQGIVNGDNLFYTWNPGSKYRVFLKFLKDVGEGKTYSVSLDKKPRQLFSSRNLIYHFEIPLEHRAWNFTDKNIKNVSARRGQPPPYRVPAAILISMKAVAMTKKAVTLTFYVIKNTTKTNKIYACFNV